MLNKRIIEDWSELLSHKLGRSSNEIIEKGLSAYDFSPSRKVVVEFSDKSICSFNFAFSVIDKEKRMVAIFTEHCGYHEFYIYGAIVREIDEDIFIDDDYEA